MKRKNIKPIVLSSLAALSLGSLSVAGSFALFTDKAETQVNIGSGIVKVDAAFDNFKVYSALADDNGTILDENNEKYVHEEQTVVDNGKHYFKNGGYAEATATDHLVLSKITPGDRIEFGLDFGNTSNVNILYRVVYQVLNENQVTDNSYLDLVKGLETTLYLDDTEKEVTFSGLKTYQTDWALLTAGVNPTDMAFAIELPMHKGNVYQDKSAVISITVEAVQSNAAVAGGVNYATIQEDIVATETATAGSQVLLSATSDSGVQTTATIPADVVSSGSVVEYTVADLGLTDNEETTNASMDFDIAFTVDGQSAGTSTEPFAQPVTVTFNIGIGKTVTSVKHNGVEMDPSSYTYDPATGVVTITSTHFSPFSIDIVNAVTVKDVTELNAALANPQFAKIALANDIVSTDIVFLNRSVNILGNGYDLKGSANRVIRVKSGNLDIDLRNLGVISTCTASSDVRGISFDNVAANVNLTMYGCRISASYYALNLIPGANNNHIRFERGTVAAGYAAINSYSNNSTFDVIDSTLRGLNDKEENAWNNFNTITFDGNCLNGGTPGTAGSNNLVNIENSTIYANSESSNKQYWVGLQYGATGNIVKVDARSSIINDAGTDMRGMMLIGYYYNWSAGQFQSYYQNTSRIEMNGKRYSISVDVENHSAQYVIEDLA